MGIHTNLEISFFTKVYTQSLAALVNQLIPEVCIISVRSLWLPEAIYCHNVHITVFTKFLLLMPAKLVII